MKKYLLNWMTIMMVAIVSVSFASCRGDDENGGNKDTDASSIVGTWVEFYEKETKWTLTDGVWVKTNEKENDSGKKGYYFGADGTYYKIHLSSDGSWEKNSTVSSYSIQGNKLIFLDKVGSNKSYTFSISGTVLEITETETWGDKREDELKRYRKM